MPPRMMATCIKQNTEEPMNSISTPFQKLRRYNSCHPTACASLPSRLRTSSARWCSCYSSSLGLYRSRCPVNCSAGWSSLLCVRLHNGLCLCPLPSRDGFIVFTNSVIKRERERERDGTKKQQQPTLFFDRWLVNRHLPAPTPISTALVVYW